MVDQISLVPMTIIGGFLGAGKTTLLNHILTGTHGVRFAVLVNDFGDLAVDTSLVREHGGDTLTFANGCVCCTLGDNFMLTLDRLLNDGSPPEHILLETSGVADPQPLADIAVLHPQLRRDIVLVLADATTLRERAADERLTDTVDRQLAAADLIVLNKCDQVTAEDREALHHWLSEKTPVQIIETRYSKLPVALLSGAGITPSNTPEAVSPAHEHAHHETEFSSVTITLNDTLDIATLRQRLTLIPSAVLRVKGFVKARPAGDIYLLQVSGKSIELMPWPQSIEPAEGKTAVVFIGTPDMPQADELLQLLCP